MNAIMVAVDYADILAVTLPYNRHHFDRVLVVTAPDDEGARKIASYNRAGVYVTDAFTRGGAVFNKWAALEEGLDVLGREGWLCVMDADVLWPKQLPSLMYQAGYLYTPRRRMWEDWPAFPQFGTWKTIGRPDGIPYEPDWTNFPLHPQQHEFAGYTQIFHASDPTLGKPPWHETNWRHAGGADSFFQAKWSPDKKVRPPFEVLHLGPAGMNWCGRATRRGDGSVPAEAAQRQQQVRAFIRGRVPGPDRFRGEKL